MEIAQNSQQLSDCVNPLAEAFQQNFGADIVTVQLVEQGCLTPIKSVWGAPVWDLSSDSLVQTAIASGKPQVCLNTDKIDQEQQDPQQFKTNLAIAITFRKEVLGILSMQWLLPNAVSNEDIVAIQQCAAKIAIALTCIRHYSSQT